MAGRYIKLYDSILEWEWSRDVNTFRLFIQLLLKANYRDLRFEGRVIRRGQLVTSLEALAFSTGLSMRQVRGSLDKLKRSGEAASESYPRYRVITVLKYDEYQTDGTLDGSRDVTLTAEKTAGSGQAEGRRAATSKEYKEYIELYNTESVGEKRQPADRFTPPSPDEVAAFCRKHGYRVSADTFCSFYGSNGWMIGKNRMKDWRSAVRYWALKGDGGPEAGAPRAKVLPGCDFEQRDYSGVPEQMMRDMERRIQLMKEQEKEQEKEKEKEREKEKEEREKAGNQAGDQEGKQEGIRTEDTVRQI